MTSETFAKVAEPTAGAVIYDGFGAGIDALNQSIVKSSPYMRKFAQGRGYAKHGPNQPNLRPNVYCHGIHALSYGENDPEGVLQALSAGQYAGSLYMGTAGFLNLSFMAAARPGAAILFDVNPVQTSFWHHILPIWAEAENGESFMDTLVEQKDVIQSNVVSIYKQSVGFLKTEEHKMPDNIPPTYVGRAIEEWRAHRGNADLRWTRDPDGFAHIKAMAQRRAIGALTLDVLDKAGWKQLADHLATSPSGAPQKVDLAYMSDIMAFFKSSLSGASDFTRRHDPNTSPGYAKEAVMQVLSERHAVITHEADPSMTWPESAGSEFGSVPSAQSFRMA